MNGSVMGEFAGTAVLVILGNGIVAGVLLARSKAFDAGWIAITAGWGLAVMAGVLVASALGDVDGHLNPAFTLASVMMTGHAERLWTYIPAQLAGGFVGAVLVWLFYRPHYAVTQDTGTKLATFCTGPAIRSLGYNLFCEALATFMLVLIATAFASKRIAPSGTAPAVGPALVGALVWSIGLSLGGTTGYAINPVRDFAPRLAHAVLPVSGKGSSDWSYAWVPVAGPFLGAIFAVAFIKLTGLNS